MEIATKEDLNKMKSEILEALESTGSGGWPARMKKKLAAKYLNTSDTRIEEWVKDGKLEAHYDQDPRLKPTTPAYFNKEDLDRIRFSSNPF